MLKKLEGFQKTALAAKFTRAIEERAKGAELFQVAPASKPAPKAPSL